MPRRTNRPPITLDDKLHYVGEVVAYLQGYAQQAIATMAFARAAIDAPLKDRGNPFEVEMGQLIERAMWEQVAIRLARMLDKPQRGKASLPEVFTLLENEIVRGAVLRSTSYAAIPASLAKREKHMGAAIQRWESVDIDPRRQRLRKLRNHSLAHNLIRKAVEDFLAGGLPIPDLVSYAEDIVGVVDDLSWACLGASSIDQLRKTAPLVARDLWGRLSRA